MHEEAPLPKTESPPDTTILNWLPKLRWFAAEILIVICGVLIALGLNTWRQNQVERGIEQNLYLDIATEFENNITTLETDLATNDSTFQIISSLNDLSDIELQAISSAELTGRFGNVINVAGFDPEIGIVRALVQSANIGTLSDRDLRLLLSRWAGLLDEKRRFSAQVFDFANQNSFHLRARATADLVWSAEERRELQSILRTYSFLHTLMIENQQKLHGVALEIVFFLEEQ